MSRGIHQVAHSWSPLSRLSPGVRATVSRLRKKLLISREVVNTVRYELEMVALRFGKVLSLRHRRIIKELNDARRLKLNVGCGSDVIDGRINIDSLATSFTTEVLLLDLRQGLPLATESAARIYSEHFLEHCPDEHIERVV